MRLGVISGHPRPAAAGGLRAFGDVDHILHAGDIGPATLLTELEALAPVTAVYGNTDGWEVRERLPRVASVELDGFSIVVTHGDQLGTPTPEKLQPPFPTPRSSSSATPTGRCSLS